MQDAELAVERLGSSGVRIGRTFVESRDHPQRKRSPLATMSRTRPQLRHMAERAIGRNEQGEAKMKFMLLQNYAPIEGVEPISIWPSEDVKAHIAAKASAAPGPGGAPIKQPIEVREVMGAPSFDG
jgi:hypothetical protein